MARLSMLAASLAGVAASSSSLRGSASCAPGQFWVNYGNTPSQMYVSWATACAAEPIVHFGYSASAQPFAVTGSAPQQYTLNSYTSPFLYHVLLTNLTVGKTVYYTVGGPTSGVSGVMNFTSRIADGGYTNPDGSPLSFALVGDLGTTANSVATVQHIQANGKLTAVIHAGDLSYADDGCDMAKGAPCEPVWDQFQGITEPVSQHTPWMTTTGNHEIESVGGQTFVAYAARFQMPAPAKDNENTWYSVNIGAAHWIMTSTYHPLAAGTPQYQWLVSDLASIDRSVTPWVFFSSHAPWYNSNYAHQGDGDAQKAAWEDMLYNAGVDMAFFGHVHAMERHHRTYKNARDPKGPVYITIGDGGNREGLASNWINPQPDITAFRQATFGHGELVVLNSTCVQWSWHQNPNAEPVSSDVTYVCKGVDV